ncbi:MAG: UdgX family uracil-DNA binding protein [Steroidobacteraceae bacterium]
MRTPDRSAATYVPPEGDLASLAAAAAGCRGCDLYERGTQTVFGAGAPRASLLFVGEQPGDQEDLAGRPFVGPAGQLLDEALARAGIERAQVYVTNAVKHFKWEPRGPRRLHKAPSVGEITACRPWLEAEIRATQPRLIVCLGVTAARSVFARAVRLGDLRGGPHATALGPPVYVTIHPSAILRMPERAMQDAEMARLVEDLRTAAAQARPDPGGVPSHLPAL